jgi:hypothetical protein
MRWIIPLFLVCASSASEVYEVSIAANPAWQQLVALDPVVPDLKQRIQSATERNQAAEAATTEATNQRFLAAMRYGHDMLSQTSIMLDPGENNARVWDRVNLYIEDYAPIQGRYLDQEDVAYQSHMDVVQLEKALDARYRQLGIVPQRAVAGVAAGLTPAALRQQAMATATEVMAQRPAQEDVPAPTEAETDHSLLAAVMQARQEVARAAGTDFAAGLEEAVNASKAMSADLERERQAADDAMAIEAIRRQGER